MFWIFVAAAIFGGAFLVPMLLGGLDTDVELDGPDVDGPELDADTDLEAADTTAGGDAFGAIVASLLSFRTVVFFSAFFGASGIVFGAVGYSSLVTVTTAVFIGAAAAAANSILFGVLKSSQANSQISDRTFEGKPATVVTPIEAGRKGRVRIDLNGQPHYLVASQFEKGSLPMIGAGTSVVVVQVENGTALVAPLPELDMLSSE